MTSAEAVRLRFRFAGPWQGQEWERPARIVLDAILPLVLEVLLALAGEKQRVLPTMDMPFLPRREAGWAAQELRDLLVLVGFSLQGDKRLMIVDASGRHNASL